MKDHLVDVQKFRSTERVSQRNKTNLEDVLLPLSHTLQLSQRLRLWLTHLVGVFSCLSRRIQYYDIFQEVTMRDVY